MDKPVCVAVSLPNGEHHGWAINCPGCGFVHMFDSRWQFNGDTARPTFDGSYLQYKGRNVPRCHAFVRDGKIQFLNDCDHELAGKTVDLKPFD